MLCFGASSSMDLEGVVETGLVGCADALRSLRFLAEEVGAKNGAITWHRHGIDPTSELLQRR